jgi:hypothetical protein
MFVELGNETAKAGYREEVDPQDHSAEDLKALAEAEGVSTEGNKEHIAARLSAKVRFTDVSDVPRVTTARFPEGVSLGEAFNSVTNVGGIWDHHGGLENKPTWVYSDSDGLAALLAEHFGCKVGQPGDVEKTHFTEAGPPGVGPDGPLDAPAAPAPEEE